jgi:hypothetical protein
MIEIAVSFESAVTVRIVTTNQERKGRAAARMFTELDRAAVRAAGILLTNGTANII